MTLFHSVALRLTLSYLAIIMLISIFFSTALYQVSSREINRGLHRQTTFLQDDRRFPEPGDSEAFERLRLEQIEESTRRLKLNLLYFNLIILLSGGAVSYYLAKKTLEPIEEAHEAQNRFTTDASHELRTPLTALKTEIEVALRDKNITLAGAKDLLKSNLEEIDKLHTLTNNLLLLASSDSRHTGLTLSQVSITGLLDTAIKKVSPISKKKKISIEKDIDEIQIEADGEDLSKLLVILLDNAIKYSHVGSKVIVAVKKKDRKVELTIQDFGIGIEAADLAHIFDRFYRTDTARAKENTGGYGLGLSIAKDIAEKHYGTLTAKSSPGRGTTFLLTLPITQG